MFSTERLPLVIGEKFVFFCLPYFLIFYQQIFDYLCRVILGVSLRFRFELIPHFFFFMQTSNYTNPSQLDLMQDGAEVQH